MEMNRRHVYGWRLRAGRLEKHPGEQEVLEVIEDGGSDHEAAAAALNAMGHRTRNGKQWREQNIRYYRQFLKYRHRTPPMSANKPRGQLGYHHTPEGRALLAKMAKMTRSGHTHQRIAELLNAEGVAALAGGKWSKTRVASCMAGVSLSPLGCEFGWTINPAGEKVKVREEQASMRPPEFTGGNTPHHVLRCLIPP